MAIGTLNEGTLHAQLKELEAEPGDRFEVELEGFVIDIVRGDQLIEIQTGSAGAMGRKLDALLGVHPIRVVHPVAICTYLNAPGKPARRSPLRGSPYDVFEWLVGVPTLLDHPHFSLDVVLIEEDRFREHDPTLRRRRGGWRVVDRRLRQVLDRHRYRSVGDLLALVPDGLREVFTTADLATGAGISRRRAQQMAYCLRHADAVIEVDRTKEGVRYRHNPAFHA
jgi:hypothetical protein